jgi:hypothetical protein
MGAHPLERKGHLLAKVQKRPETALADKGELCQGRLGTLSDLATSVAGGLKGVERTTIWSCAGAHNPSFVLATDQFAADCSEPAQDQLVDFFGQCVTSFLSTSPS